MSSLDVRVSEYQVLRIRKGNILLLDNLVYLLNESNVFDSQVGTNDEFGNIWEEN